MRTMGAGQFKAKCLAVLDEVHETGEPVLITKRGKPVARVTVVGESPSRQMSVDSIFESLQGLMSVADDAGDLAGPIFPIEDWDHLKDDGSPLPPK